MSEEATQTVGNRNISRTEVSINGTEMRLYSDGTTQWPSVSTVVNARPTPDKDKSIQGWKNWLRGQPDRPDPSDVLQFKSWRGTLAHYKALNPLADRGLAGDEEVAAYDGLDGWYYRHDDALTQAKADIDWFLDAFQAMAETENIAHWDDDGTLITNNAIAVEQYVVNDHVGYAGQFDLAYTTDGQTIVADLKTSKATSTTDLLDKKWPDYGMQLAAYARAAPFEVDAIQVLWGSPDEHEYAVIDTVDMPDTRDAYDMSFRKHCERVHQTTLNSTNP